MRPQPAIEALSNTPDLGNKKPITPAQTCARRPAGLRRPPVPSTTSCVRHTHDTRAPPWPRPRSPRHAPTRCIPPPPSPPPTASARSRPRRARPLNVSLSAGATGQGIAKPGAALTGVLCCETATGFDGICTAVGCRAVIYSPYARFSQSRGGVGESLIVLAAPTNPAVTRASPQGLNQKAP